MKIAIISLFTIILVVVLTACGNSTSTTNETTTIQEATTFNLLEGQEWIDDNEVSTDETNSYRGKKSYSMLTTDDSILEITPHKYHKLDGLSIDLNNVDLNQYKKLVISAKGDGLMKLIITSRVQITGGKNQIMIPLSYIEDSFEFNLDFEGYEAIRNSIERITLVFGADVNEQESNLSSEPAIHEFNSKIYISKLEFSTEDASPEITYNEQGQLYDPSTSNDLPDTVDINKNWEYNDENSYIIDETDNGTVISTTTSKLEWSFIYLTLEGNLKAYSKIVIEVQGDATAKFKMKLEGPNITTIETGSTTNNNIEDPILDGNKQTFTWNVSQDNMTSGEAIKLLIFFEPGNLGTGVSMTITSLELKK